MRPYLLRLNHSINPYILVFSRLLCHAILAEEYYPLLERYIQSKSLRDGKTIHQHLLKNSDGTGSSFLLDKLTWHMLGMDPLNSPFVYTSRCGHLMANLVTGSQSSLMLPQLRPHAILTGRGPSFINYGGVTVSCYKPVASGNSIVLPTSALSYHSPCLLKEFGSSLVSRASSLDVKVPGEVVDVKVGSTGGGGGGDEGSGKDGNGGGGGGGGGDNGENRGGEGSDESDAKRNKALLMSQKFTLAYAALVGLGGFVGYLKSGSQKSLAYGGLSALLLYYVYTELPKRPVFASVVGLGVSAALLVVMGSRFKESGKLFPAGVISLVSLIMTGGYIHGIMKTH